jgi:neutral ceramidase
MPIYPKPTRASICVSEVARLSLPTRPSRRTDLFSSTLVSQNLHFPFARLTLIITPRTRSDIAFGDTGIRRSILSNLADLYPGVYTETNVAIVSTHQHAGVGGYPENLLPQITSFGYVPETADAIVQGTVRAVQRAHASLAPGSLSVGNVTINGGNRNRSPNAYLANPASERARYNGDQDTALSLLKFTDASGTARGFLSFFAVHGTSLYEVKWLQLQGGINLGAHLLKEQHLG